jgi:hypothetical protein
MERELTQIHAHINSLQFSLFYVFGNLGFPTFRTVVKENDKLIAGDLDARKG